MRGFWEKSPKNVNVHDGYDSWSTLLWFGVEAGGESAREGVTLRMADEFVSAGARRVSLSLQGRLEFIPVSLLGVFSSMVLFSSIK